MNPFLEIPLAEEVRSVPIRRYRRLARVVIEFPENAELDPFAMPTVSGVFEERSTINGVLVGAALAVHSYTLRDDDVALNPPVLAAVEGLVEDARLRIESAVAVSGEVPAQTESETQPKDDHDEREGNTP